MKTVRITFLCSPDFKLELEEQARALHISVGELIRSCFTKELSYEGKLLQATLKELHAANNALGKTFLETNQLLDKLDRKDGNAAPA